MRIAAGFGMADPDRQETDFPSTVLSSTIGCLPTMSKLTP